MLPEAIAVSRIAFAARFTRVLANRKNFTALVSAVPAAIFWFPLYLGNTILTAGKLRASLKLKRSFDNSAMNNARAMLGVILAAAALACIATVHHVLWSRLPSLPQPIEAPQKAGSLALRVRSARVCRFAEIHSYGSDNQTAGTAARRARAGTNNAGTARRVDAQPDVPTTSPSHAQPADVCARYGGRRVDFMRGHHAMWRCIYPRHR